MSAFTAIELEKLPAPQIVESLSFAVIKQALLDDLKTRDPNYTAIVESDPAYKLLEVAAYRELLLRARVNDAAKGVMLAYATGSDLDHLGALYGVQRFLVSPADPTARPPVAAVWEADSRLRHRIQLALEGFTTAGSHGSYVFWGLSSSPKVKDIDVQSPRPGEVIVTVLNTDGDGTATPELLTTVFNALNEEEIRPLTDRVVVQSASVTHYQVEADIYFYKGPDQTKVLEYAQTQAETYVQTHHLLGHDIPQSGLFASLHVTGVQSVDLLSPTTHIEVGRTASAFCTQVLLHNKGIAE